MEELSTIENINQVTTSENLFIHDHEEIHLLDKTSCLKTLSIKFQSLLMHIQDILPKFSNLKDLQTLNLDFSYIFMVSSSILDGFFAKVFQKTPNLKNLTLSFTSITQSFLTQNLLEEIAKEMPSSLQELNLDFSVCKSFDNKSLEVISTAIEKNKGLERLRIEAPHTIVTGEGIKNLGNALKVQENLLEITLNFNKCPNLDNQVLATIGQNLKNSKGIRSFTLRFMKNEDFNDDGFEEIGKLLLELKDLETLTLDLTDCPNITDQSLFFLKEAFEELNNVKKLVLMLTSPDGITDDGFEHFCTGLKHLTKLNSLALAFQFCENLTENSMVLFSEAIESMGGLQNLTLDLEGAFGINDSGVYALFEKVVKLDSLAKVALNFSGCEEINGECFKGLNQGKIQNPIHSLLINFKGCALISPNIKDLSAGLVDFPSLKDLVLNFSGNKNLDSQSNYDLFREIFASKTLKTFNCDMSDISELKNLAMEDLKSAESSSIEDITLKFSNSGLSDESFKAIIHILSNIKLRELSIDMSNNETLTGKAIESLLESLSHMKQLKCFELNFLNCKNLPESEDSLEGRISKILPETTLIIDE